MRHIGGPAQPAGHELAVVVDSAGVAGEVLVDLDEHGAIEALAIAGIPVLGHANALAHFRHYP